MTEPAGEIILYRSDDGEAVIRLRAVGGTVWLSQAQMAELYDTSTQNIQQIIARILADGEVGEATINSELIVRSEGNRRVRREIKVYNLDMVLAVGYRVTTQRGVQFRQWATTVLREYLVKGFALQDEQLKDADAADSFDELLARIREIRASEKRFYQKVRDIFAVTGRTAAELVLERTDPSKPTMGLTTWKGSRVRKSDVGISKNYLAEAEITELNRLTTMFLDFAEDRAERRQQTLVADWVMQADRFLDFNERAVLEGAGTASAGDVERIVGDRYAAFDARRRELEAQHAADEEERDLAELIDIERRGGEKIEDGH